MVWFDGGCVSSIVGEVDWGTRFYAEFFEDLLTWTEVVIADLHINERGFGLRMRICGSASSTAIRGYPPGFL